MNIPPNLLVLNWDKQAASLLSPDQLARYHEQTREARQVWQEKQAIYEHCSGQALVRGKHPWRDLEAKTASHFMVYQQKLWSVLMSIRVGKS